MNTEKENNEEGPPTKEAVSKRTIAITEDHISKKTTEVIETLSEENLEIQTASCRRTKKTAESPTKYQGDCYRGNTRQRVEHVREDSSCHRDTTCSGYQASKCVSKKKNPTESPIKIQEAAPKKLIKKDDRKTKDKKK